MSEDQLTDEEFEEAQRNHKALREAYARNPEATRQAMKDAVKSPPKTGKAK